MRSLLFLCHRLPWPPDKGDKIRSYHVLRRLAPKYRVYLGAFVDDPADWRYLDAVRALCADTCIRPLPAWRTRGRALVSLARGEALTPGCYRDRVMRQWVDRLVHGHEVDLALCYSSGVATLVMPHLALPRVMDFVDADSDKWRQYAASRRGLARRIFCREAVKLAQYEQDIAEIFDAGLFVSEAEAGFFRDRNHGSGSKIRGVANGVDLAYWDPRREYPGPYPAGQRNLVFVGAMDYRANVHAVQWFAHEVWPRIVARCPDAGFCIVGARPTREVRRLAGQPGIAVTGGVEDVRPYLAHAHAVVAPLRIARGIQNKVLEALAMEKVVLGTPAAWEGIGNFEGREGCISEDPGDMAAQALRWLERVSPRQVGPARAMVRQRFDWDRNLDAYEAVLRRVSTERSLAAPLRRLDAQVLP